GGERQAVELVHLDVFHVRVGRQLAHQHFGLDAVELAAGGDDFGTDRHAALVAQRQRCAAHAGGRDGAGGGAQGRVALGGAGVLGAAVDVLDDEAVVLFGGLQAAGVDAVGRGGGKDGEGRQGHGGGQREGVDARSAELCVGH